MGRNGETFWGNCNALCFDAHLLRLTGQYTYDLDISRVPGEDAVKTIEMRTKDLKYYMKLANKVVTGLRGSTPILKEVLPSVKMLSNNINILWRNCSFMKSQFVQPISLLSYFKKLPQPPQPSPP